MNLVMKGVLLGALGYVGWKTADFVVNKVRSGLQKKRELIGQWER